MSAQAIEAILADFRTWLEQARTAVPAGTDGVLAAEPVDLHTLVSQFVSLRHEVNLQTKATRTQQEKSAEALHQLAQALEALEQSQAARQLSEEQAQDERLRPLLKTLVDLHDALSLARREISRVEESLQPALLALDDLDHQPPLPEPLSVPTATPAAQKRSFWGRLFGSAGPGPQAVSQDETAALREYIDKQQRQLAALQQRQGETRRAAERIRQFLASVITGYTMSLQRVERALQQHGLEAIPCVGEVFDPETMEVVEVVTDSGRSATEVIEEVRRGYRWRGRLFRFAQVRVARP
jgi:molecular chaperone GrpE